ncbi:hypothetical protein [Paenibacillus wynnii]|uniref:hypothetical protein n=1 Tax=Paenibacillus wynnii TaxID=268407 RepID=UPI002794829B|nr:hypothetical protein [Paenibacillus wynnii]MDQ0196298.1 hypothetical protein [Paenibacillus wynnii]
MKGLRVGSSIVTLSACFLLGTGLVHADFGTAHIKQGSINGGSATALKYWYDSSVSTFGYAGAFDNAMSQWDAASSFKHNIFRFS